MAPRFIVIRMTLHLTPTLYVRERLVIFLLLGLVLFISLVTGEKRYADYLEEESVESSKKENIPPPQKRVKGDTARGKGAKKRPSLEKSVKKDD